MQLTDYQLTAFFFCLIGTTFPSAYDTGAYFIFGVGVSSLGVFIKIGFECVFKIDFRRQTELAPEAPTGLLH